MNLGVLRMKAMIKCRDNSYQLRDSNDHPRNAPLVKDEWIIYLSRSLLRFKYKLSQLKDVIWTVGDVLFPMIPNTRRNNMFWNKTNSKQYFQGWFEGEAEIVLSCCIRHKKRLFKCFLKICPWTSNSASLSPSIAATDALSSCFSKQWYCSFRYLVVT